MKPERVGAASRQGPRGPGWPVGERLDRLHDTTLRLGSDNLGARQHPRDGGDRDAGAGGNVLDRHRGSARASRPAPPAPPAVVATGPAHPDDDALAVARWRCCRERPRSGRRRGGRRRGGRRVGTTVHQAPPPTGWLPRQARPTASARAPGRGTSNRQPGRIDFPLLQWPVYPITLGMSPKCKRLPGGRPAVTAGPSSSRIGRPGSAPANAASGGPC